MGKDKPRIKLLNIKYGYDAMSQESLEMFLGRLITDDHFRRLASKSFFNASLEYGFKLTQDEQKLLREIDFNKFTHLAKNLDGRIKRSCGE